MENKSRIDQFISDIFYMKSHEDKEGLVALLKEGRAESVTLEDVAVSLMNLSDEFMNSAYIAQLLMEQRLRAIVTCLAEETKNKIYMEFSEAEDDLFTDEEGDK